MLEYIKQYIPPPPYTRQDIGFSLLPVLVAVIVLIIDRYGLQQLFVSESGSTVFHYRWISIGDASREEQVNFAWCVRALRRGLFHGLVCTHTARQIDLFVIIELPPA